MAQTQPEKRGRGHSRGSGRGGRRGRRAQTQKVEVTLKPDFDIVSGVPVPGEETAHIALNGTLIP